MECTSLSQLLVSVSVKNRLEKLLTFGDVEILMQLSVNAISNILIVRINVFFYLLFKNIPLFAHYNLWNATFYFKLNMNENLFSIGCKCCSMGLNSNTGIHLHITFQMEFSQQNDSMTSVKISKNQHAPHQNNNVWT